MEVNINWNRVLFKHGSRCPAGTVPLYCTHVVSAVLQSVSRPSRTHRVFCRPLRCPFRRWSFSKINSAVRVWHYEQGGPLFFISSRLVTSQSILLFLSQRAWPIYSFLSLFASPQLFHDTLLANPAGNSVRPSVYASNRVDGTLETVKEFLWN